MNTQQNKKSYIPWLIFAITVIVVFFLGMLASSIMERRAEAAFVYTPKVEISDWEARNWVWGENFPREYQSYLQTADTTFRSKYLGNAMIRNAGHIRVFWCHLPQVNRHIDQHRKLAEDFLHFSHIVWQGSSGDNHVVRGYITRQNDTIAVVDDAALRWQVDLFCAIILRLALPVFHLYNLQGE